MQLYSYTVQHMSLITEYSSLSLGIPSSSLLSIGFSTAVQLALASTVTSSTSRFLLQGGGGKVKHLYTQPKQYNKFYGYSVGSGKHLMLKEHNLLQHMRSWGQYLCAYIREYAYKPHPVEYTVRTATEVRRVCSQARLGRLETLTSFGYPPVLQYS